MSTIFASMSLLALTAREAAHDKNADMTISCDTSLKVNMAIHRIDGKNGPNRSFDAKWNFIDNDPTKQKNLFEFVPENPDFPTVTFDASQSILIEINESHTINQMIRISSKDGNTMIVLTLLNAKPSEIHRIIAEKEMNVRISSKVHKRFHREIGFRVKMLHGPGRISHGYCQFACKSPSLFRFVSDDGNIPPFVIRKNESFVLQFRKESKKIDGFGIDMIVETNSGTSKTITFKTIALTDDDVEKSIARHARYQNALHAWYQDALYARYVGTNEKFNKKAHPKLMNKVTTLDVGDARKRIDFRRRYDFV